MTLVRPSQIRDVSYEDPIEAPYVETIETLPVGAAPLIAAVVRYLGIDRIIDREASWDSKRCILSPGERVLALIVNFLCEERRPLYKVGRSFESRDTELLFGKGIAPEHLNDDCLARGLDALWKVNPSRIFRLAADSLRLLERLEVPFLHFDTTTRVLYGDYETDPPRDPLLEELLKSNPALGARLDRPEPSEPSPKTSGERQPATPAYGHSKDRRDDLKQIIFSVAVDSHGLPLLGSVKDGNASDKVSNLEMIEEILAFFPPDFRDSMVYIADSALVTEKNLTRLTEEKIRFVSLLPGTFSCGHQVREKAWEGTDWEEIGTISSGKDPASYRASEQEALIGATSYRLIVYHSSALDKRKTRGLLTSATKEKASLEKKARDLAKKSFLCAPDATKAGEEFCRSHKSRVFPLSFVVTKELVSAPRSGRGRPPKGAPPSDKIPLYRVNVTVGGLEESKVSDLLDRASCFVLVTNLPKAEFSARRILSEYKGQAVVEKVFSTVIKEPVVLDAFFVKKTTRLDALGHVLLLATLVYMWLQFRLRRAGIRLDCPPRGLLENPTSREILQQMGMASLVKFPGEVRKIHMPPRHLTGFKQTLAATGFDERIYVVPYERKSLGSTASEKEDR